MKICDVCTSSEVNHCNGCHVDLCDEHDTRTNHEQSCPFMAEQKINFANSLVSSAELIFKIKPWKKESDTIIRVSDSKLSAFNARINYLKRNKSEINLFDLAGNSKKQLQVWPKGEKTYGIK